MDKNILLVGTSHIAKDSLKKIKEQFFSFSPDIIAVELDRRRLHSLLHKEKTSYHPKIISQIGVKGYLFAVIGGWLQKKLGKIVQVEPGSDMLQAVYLAKNNQKKLLLLDQDITQTLSRIHFSAKEKRRLFYDIFFAWTNKKNRISLNLEETPGEELVEKLLEQLKGRYPSLYQTLVHERNVYMAKRLSIVRKQHPEDRILVIIGAGHKKGLQEEYDLLRKKTP